MSEYEFVRKNLTLSADFNSYLLSNPDFLSELPKDVHIVFEIKSNRSFSDKNLEVVKKSHEKYLIATKSGSKWHVKSPRGAQN